MGPAPPFPPPGLPGLPPGMPPFNLLARPGMVSCPVGQEGS